MGTCDIFLAANLSTGKVLCDISDSHKGEDFNAWLQRIRDSVPLDKTIILIMDNHSSHLTSQNMEYLLDAKNKFEIVLTPVHGSWLDPSESYLSILSKQVLAKSRFENKDKLRSAVKDWAERRRRKHRFSFFATDYRRLKNMYNDDVNECKQRA